MTFVHAVAAGLAQSIQFFWDSLFGLIFGFLISAVVQVVLTPATMHRYLGGNLRGIVSGAGFGVIASACSYGASAAAKGFYQRGADIRAVFAFLISSTNMNLAILILFWSLLGWKFAFAEFFGGIIIIAVVVTGFSVIFGGRELERLRREHPSPAGAHPEIVTECPICGMEGEPDLAVAYAGRTYLACGAKHAKDLAADPGVGSAVVRMLPRRAGARPAGVRSATRQRGGRSRKRRKPTSRCCATSCSWDISSPVLQPR